MDRRRLELRLKQAPHALARLARDRRWLKEGVGNTGSRRHTKRRVEPSNRPAGVSAAAAVAATLGVTQPEYEGTVAELWKPEVHDTGALTDRNAREELQDVIGAVIRLTHPMVVVEIGGAMGLTSAVILAALEANGDGQLYSIAVPGQDSKPEEVVKSALPEKLKPRWTLELGPSRQVLPELVQHVAPIDVSVHDAEHTHSGRLEEYRTVWPHLRPGAVLVSRDVGSSAFQTFAREIGAEPHLIDGDDEGAPVGLMRKGFA
jgi:predicted O-methyltransferase YrrM